MKTYIVHSDISPAIADPETWIMSIPKMLNEAKVEDVKHKTAYCSMPDRKVLCEFEGPDKDAVKNALNKIGIPFTALTEVKVLRPYPLNTGENVTPFHNPHSHGA
jgi:hypothetical protein